MCVLTRTRLSRLLAWRFSSWDRGSLTFICSDHRSLSITLSRYSCTRSHHPRQSQVPVLMSKPTRSQTCFNLQSGVNQVFQLPAHLPVLVQFPHLQEVRAAPDRRSLWCGSPRPRLQGQTPAHIGAKRRSQSPLLQRRDWRQCLSALALARGASAPQGAPVPLFQGSLASCGSSGWAGWCLGSVSTATTESKHSGDSVFGWW